MILAKNPGFLDSPGLPGTVGHGRQAHKKASKTELHRLLRVSPHEKDPVMIILAAQIQLRRWRRAEPGQSPTRIRQRIRKITAARDVLLMVQTGSHAAKPLSRTV
jgi:hypothetical protein